MFTMTNESTNEPVRLTTDSQGFVECPRRGEISAEWCEGCPRRVHLEGSATAPDAVVCVPGTDVAPTTWEPMRFPPDLGQVR